MNQLRLGKIVSISSILALGFLTTACHSNADSTASASPVDNAAVVTNTTSNSSATTSCPVAPAAVCPALNLTAEMRESYLATLPVTDGNWSRNLAVPAFDTSKGALERIEMHVVAESSDVILYENMSPSPVGFQVTFKKTITLGSPAGLDSLGFVEVDSAYSHSAAAYDGHTDFFGASGYQTQKSTEVTTDITVTDTAMLGQFTGTDVILVPVTGVHNSVSSIGGGNYTLSLNQYSGAAVLVTYVYSTTQACH